MCGGLWLFVLRSRSDVRTVESSGVSRTFSPFHFVWLFPRTARVFLDGYPCSNTQATALTLASTRRFDDNAAVLLNNKREMLGTRIGGVVSADLRMRGWSKIVSLAPKVSCLVQNCQGECPDIILDLFHFRV